MYGIFYTQDIPKYFTEFLISNHSINSIKDSYISHTVAIISSAVVRVLNNAACVIQEEFQESTHGTRPGILQGAKGPLTYAKPALQNGKQRSSPNYSEVFIPERPAVERDKSLNLSWPQSGCCKAEIHISS